MCLGEKANQALELSHQQASLLPACLNSKLRVPFFNSKHRILTFQISIRLFNHELNVNHSWSKAVLRHLIYKKDCQTGHDNHAFQISKLYPCVNLRQQKDLCLSHITSSSLLSISALKFNIESSML